MTTLKAYQVREPDEGCCVVVYAESNVVARRRGANELNIEFEEVESCTRIPSMDCYSPGPAPVDALLANGWWYTCHGCDRTFDSDGYRGEDEEAPWEFEPVSDSKNNAYCCTACMMNDWAQAQAIKARNLAAVEHCLYQWPQAIKVTPFSRNGDPSSFDTCNILLPELEFPVTWTRGTDSLSVSQCDLEAYKRLHQIHRDVDEDAPRNPAVEKLLTRHASGEKTRQNRHTGTATWN